METLQCGNNTVQATPRKRELTTEHWREDGKWSLFLKPSEILRASVEGIHMFWYLGLLLSHSYHKQQQAPLFHQELASQRCWTLNTWFSIRYHSHSQHQHKLSVPVVFVLLCWVGLAVTLSFKINWVCLKTFKLICVASGPFLKEIKNYCLWNSIRN